MTNPSIQQAVARTARGLGFHLAGIAPIALDAPAPAVAASPEPSPKAAPTLPELANFSRWIDEGRAGEMEYLKRRDASGHLLRSSAQVPFPWARSVIVCAVNYNSGLPFSIDRDASAQAENSGWIARYAWSGQAASGSSADAAPLSPTDYHLVIRQRLDRLRGSLEADLGPFQSRCFVDTGPLVERVYAKYAGLGWQGKNTCLINESYGSWIFLGVIVTSLDLPPSDRVSPMPDRCGSCTRCIDACPTQALEPYRMDAARCIAYLTIEKRGEISPGLAGMSGRHVFGCDICQEVCPWNDRGGRRTPITDWPELQPRQELVNPALDWLAGLDDKGWIEMFRKSPLERARQTGFMRNVKNARQNSEKKKKS